MQKPQIRKSEKHSKENLKDEKKLISNKPVTISRFPMTFEIV